MKKLPVYIYLFSALLCLGSAGVLAADSDGDGIDDTVDAFPLDPCGATDTDNDGSPNTILACALAADSFETGNLSALSWTTGGSANWTANGIASHSGTYGARSGTVATGQTSWLQLNHTSATSGSIVFWLRYSNGSAPAVVFTIDGVQNSLGVTTTWTRFQLPVTAGAHTYQWNFVKAGAVSSSGLYLDDLSILPSALVEDSDDDNDGVADTLDAFPLNLAASMDNDNDGMPEMWNVGCDSTCQAASGLMLDPTADGAIDISFDPGSGANATVNTTLLQGDGKVIIGGSFTSFNGTTINRIARLNVNGTLDTDFNPGSGANSGAIRAIALQSDNKIIIGGSFTSFNGTSAVRLARLNADGSRDTTFNSGGAGANNTVMTAVLQPDGKIMMGGDFTTLNGTARNRIARLNADGSLDTTFDPGTGVDNTIDAIVLQADGKMVIGGFFTTYNGTARKCVARLNSDGSLDTTFDPGTGADWYVHAMALQADGKVIIGGDFTTFNGIARNNVARVNTDGSLDTGFNPGSGANGMINTVVLQPDGKPLIGGTFNLFNGTTRNLVARLNTDGTVDPSFNPGSGANIVITTISLRSNGRAIIAGNFTTVNGFARNRVAQIIAGSDADGDGLTNDVDPDDDNDTVLDVADNCQWVANLNQLNTDGDSYGNACDTDDDNDGVVDSQDALPLDASETVDTDSDGTGNNADTDDDNDTVPDVSDNCPLTSNSNQFDNDGDTKGDACDASPYAAVRADIDNDADGDLVFQDGSGSVSSWQLEDAAVQTVNSSIGSITPHVLGMVCDIDADFDADLLFQNAGTGGVVLWVMQGGVKQSETWLGALSGYTLSACGDTNKDGKNDLVFSDASGNFAVMLMDSNHTVLSTNWLAQFSGWGFAAIADVDYDGDKDIVMQTAAGDIGLITLESGNTQSASWLGQWSGGWSVVGSGDADNDNDDDLFIATPTGDIGIVKLQAGANVGSDWFGNWANTSVKAIGDIDNDGDSDVIFQSTAYDLDVVDVQNAQKSGARWLGQLSGYDIKGALDVDADGDDDLVLQDGSGNVAVVVMEAGDKQSLPWLGSNSGAVKVFP